MHHLLRLMWMDKILPLKTDVNEFKNMNHSNYITEVRPMTKLKRKLCKMVGIKDITPMQTKGKF